MREHLKEYIEGSQTTSVRGLRILLEYFHATEVFEPIQREKIKIVSVFGSARTKKIDSNFRLAHQLGGLLYNAGFAVVTGASQGIMEAANQGVADAIAHHLLKGRKGISLEQVRETAPYQRLLKKRSAGLKITLPFEAQNNPYIGLGATFHYFMVRKFFFASLSSGFIACEGGWGTRDELYEMLTLVQTGKAPLMPIIYLSENPEHIKNDLEYTRRRKYIDPQDVGLIHFAKTPREAVTVLKRFYNNVDQIHYEKEQTVVIELKGKIPFRLRQRVEKKASEIGSKLGHLVWGNHPWGKNRLTLERYCPSSYSHLRGIIDLLNSV